MVPNNECICSYNVLTCYVILIPAWLRFLEWHELIDKQQREKTLLDIRELTNGLLKTWEGYLADPALRDGLKKTQMEGIIQI